MARKFTRRKNRMPGLPRSGDVIAAEHINELQVALEDDDVRINLKADEDKIDILVAQSIAADNTVAEAAGAAVTTALVDANVTPLSRFEPVETGVAAVTPAPGKAIVGGADGPVALDTDVFDARLYGVAGDGAAIQAAIDAAEVQAALTGRRQTVYVAPIPWTILGTTPLRIRTSHIHLSAIGATFTAPDMGGTGILSIQGTAALDVTTLTAAPVKGNWTITVASTVGLAVGTIIMLTSAEVFSVDRPTAQKGEWATIAGIAGTTLTLTQPIRDTYDHATYPVSVGTMTPLEEILIDGPVITGNGTIDQIGIDAMYCKDIEFRDVDTINTKYAGIQANNCIGVRFTRCDPSGSNQAGLGYGLIAAGSEHVLWEDCTGRGNRHTVDATSGPGRPLSRHLTMRRVIAHGDTSAGISTHEGCEYVTIEQCQAIGCGGGIVSRGRYTKIMDCDVMGVRSTGESYHHGIMVGANTYNGLAGTGLEIRGCRIDMSGGSGTSGSGINIRSPLVDARIEGNTIIKFQAHGIHFQGLRTRNVLVQDNTVDFTGIPPELFLAGIWFVQQTMADGNTHRGLTIRNNRIVDCPGNAIRVHGNHVAGVNAARGIVIANNDITGFTNNGIHTGSGYFVDVTVDVGYVTTTTNLLTPGVTESFRVTAFGAGDPNTRVRGGAGSVYTRTDGGTGTTLYIKEGTGTGTSGWVAK